MSDRKLIGEWKGELDLFGTRRERKIQIFKVKNQKNKIVFPDFPGFGKGSGVTEESGSLLDVRRSKNKLTGPKAYTGKGVSIIYGARGSHQGGKMHSYNKHVALFSKDEKKIESLMKFLTKFLTKGKVKKTIKKGGSKGGGSNKSSFTKKYTKISKIDCQKKNPKSRDKTLKCLDDKKEQINALAKDSPKDMKELQKMKKNYQKSIKKLMKKITKDCMKYQGDDQQLKKCAEKEKKELESHGKDIPKIVMDDMRDNIQRMFDHTQKVDFGVFSDFKKGGGKKRTKK